MSIIKIQNATGASIKFRGKAYASGAYVDMSKVMTYKVEYCKLWGSDTGRSMTGENKGTLIGIFPKITLKCGKMNDEDMGSFVLLANVPATNVQYYDVMRHSLVTNSFYFGDISDELQKARTLKHKAAEVSIIARKKR